MARALKGTEAWVVDWRWVDTEGIRSFAGLPLVADEQLRGVLAVFSRRVLDEAAEVELSRLAGDVAVALGAAAKTEALERDRQVLLAELDRAEDTAALHDVVLAGASAAARRIVQQVHLASTSDASVLIVGASGTEPTSVARAIHARRAGPGGPFFRIDASRRSTSVEARLFGVLSLASGGTLLLENVEDLDPQLQRRLAAWLDQRARPRPGEPSVRVMATAAPEPLRDPDDGRLLPELLDRLAVIRIDVPPLAARRDDIGDIARVLAGQVARQIGRGAPALPPATLDRLRAYGWPGNLAELHAVLERAVRICDDTLALDALEFPPPSASTPEPLPSAILTRAQLRHRERESIRAALRTAHGRVSGSGGAAEILGMKPTTLSSRIKALGLAHAARRRGSSGGRRRDSPRRRSE